MNPLRFNRFARLASVVVAASALAACNTPPRMGMGMGTGMPMGAAAGGSTATPDHMAKMDVQMKSMQAMHEKMMNAKTPAERNALMAEHMKSMQGGMAMMEGMGGMQGAPSTPGTPGVQGGMGGGMMGGMGARHQMMEKRMEMMQMMMKMMMDRMPPAPAK